MGEVIVKPASYDDVTYVKLAREIAMDLRNIDDILATHGVSKDTWAKIEKTSHFQSLLRNEVEAWQSAGNTSERVKLKALAFVEEALPEFYARAHDRVESLSSKVEVLKTVAKFAGIGTTNIEGQMAERLLVTINLGGDHQLRIEKDVTPKVIEGEVINE